MRFLGALFCHWNNASPGCSYWEKQSSNLIIMKYLKNVSLLAAMVSLVVSSTYGSSAKDGWMTDYESALAAAKEPGKPVLVEFHGSDWCPPCIQLNKQVLTQDAFKAYASEALVLVDADFPRKTELSEAQRAHNEALAEKFGVEYFPTVLILDSEGKVLDKMVGFPDGGLEGFLSFIKAQVES